jgi:polyvinyl alcohol dehydrogenase (cytochrome)
MKPLIIKLLPSTLFTLFFVALPGLGQDAAPPENADAKLMSNHCDANPGLGNITAKPSWNGWGAGLANARFQEASAAQLDPEQVPKLKLKWAFGFPGAKAVYGQPTVVAGRVFLGVDTAYVYSIDAATGCVYWSYHAAAPVRSALSIGPAQASGRYLAYFGDLKGNVYAVDAATGEQVWKINLDKHPVARITGAPQIYQNRLYVPVASFEEVSAADPTYQCCTFRGSVAALDAQTGRQIWKSYIIPEANKPTGKNAKGVQQFGPAGGGVWSSPTLDPKRHALYVGTGDAYTAPAAKTTDAIVALDLDSGKMLWSVQDTPGDAWVVGCVREKDRENCPKDAGPDYDFGSSPILQSLPGGKSILVAGQKSGNVWGHDPDRKGAVVWKTAVFSTPPKPQGQIVWGGTADNRNAYFGLNSGGIVALSLTNGEREWSALIEPTGGRNAGHDAAITAMPGVIFSGGWDGVLRALSTKDGKILWDFDMVQEFKTVNGVAAKGGSMGSSGPTIAGGMVFAGAGYPGVQNGVNGNVLLAFGVE